MTYPIKNQKLWDKIKDLKGTSEEIRRLEQLKAEKKIDFTDYWVIKLQWVSNKKLNKNNEKTV